MLNVHFLHHVTVPVTDLDRARDAYVLLKRNFEENPGDSVAAWHFSLSCYYMGKRAVNGDGEARKRIHQEGRDAADQALKKWLTKTNSAFGTEDLPTVSCTTFETL